MKTLTLLSVLLLVLLGFAYSQSIVGTTVSPPTTQIDLSVVNPAPGTSLGRYVVSFGVTGSNGSFQPVAPVCLYMSQNGIGPAWDTTHWPADTYTIQATLWLPPSTINVKSNCSNISGQAYGTAVDYITLP